MTQAQRIEAVRTTWATYQADASRERRADVPSIHAFWAAVRELQYPTSETEA